MSSCFILVWWCDVVSVYNLFLFFLFTTWYDFFFCSSLFNGAPWSTSSRTLIHSGQLESSESRAPGPAFRDFGFLDSSFSVKTRVLFSSTRMLVRCNTRHAWRSQPVILYFVSPREIHQASISPWLHCKRYPVKYRARVYICLFHFPSDPSGI